MPPCITEQNVPHCPPMEPGTELRIVLGSDSQEWLFLRDGLGVPDDLYPFVHEHRALQIGLRSADRRLPQYHSLTLMRNYQAELSNLKCQAGGAK